LDEAAHNLTKVQNRVISDIENRLGMACMQLRKYKEAYTYFQRAVQLGCPPAAFNLGLCYESGIGTSQDFKLVLKMHAVLSMPTYFVGCLGTAIVLHYFFLKATFSFYLEMLYHLHKYFIIR
jgi:TPR repeat protein